MATTGDIVPAHAREDIARRDAMVRDLCDRLGFEFVMESAARQAALRRAPRPAASGAKAAPKGVETIHAALQDLEALAGASESLRVRIGATEALEQIQAFLKAARGRAIIGVRPSVPIEFGYDAGTRTLTAAGLPFPLHTLGATHGRLHSEPRDEAKTVHTLTLRAGSGTTIVLGLA